MGTLNNDSLGDLRFQDDNEETKTSSEQVRRRHS